MCIRDRTGLAEDLAIVEVSFVVLVDLLFVPSTVVFPVTLVAGEWVTGEAFSLTDLVSVTLVADE